MTGRWELLPHALIRSTGFPVSLVDELAFPDTVAALDRLAAAEQRLTALGASLAERLRTGDPETRRRVLRRVRRRRAVEEPAFAGWDAALAERDAAEQGAAAALAAELPGRRAALRAIAADERFAEAVWLSSPQMYEHGLRAYLAGTGPPTDRRRTERQLVAYVQRFAAKNDTAAFFGPLDYADFAPPDPGTVHQGPGTTSHRQAYVAHWAVLALAAAVADDPAVRPYLMPRLGTVHRVDPVAGTVAAPGGPPRRLSPLAAAVLRQVDGTATVAKIAAGTGAGTAAVLVELDRLAARHVLALDPPIPVVDPHPVRHLVDWVRALPADCAARDNWLGPLAELAELEAGADRPLAAKRAALAAAERRFTGLTRRSARRGGDFYADRSLVYEEAVGGITPSRLGPVLADRLAAGLAPVLDLVAAHACHVQAEVRAHGRRRLAELAGPAGGDVPLLHWVRALAGEPVPEPASPWSRALLAQLAGREGESEVPLDPGALPPVDPAVLAGEILLTSPDVLLIAADQDALAAGDVTVVLGECHDALLLWGWPLQFHPERAAVERTVADLIARAAAGRSAASVLPGRRVKIIPFEYPGPTVELTGRSGKRAADRVPVVEVTVAVRDGRPVLRAPGRADFVLHNGELATLAHRVLGLPRVVPPVLDAGPHTPRLTMGGLVLQRERWRVARDELFPRRASGDSVDLFADYRRAAGRLGLPRRVFAKVPGERKPVLVDADSWFLVQLLHHTVPPGAEVVLTEMLPGPDQLWLRGPAGAYTAELRLGMGRVPR